MTSHSAASLRDGHVPPVDHDAEPLFYLYADGWRHNSQPYSARRLREELAWFAGWVGWPWHLNVRLADPR